MTQSTVQASLLQADAYGNYRGEARREPPFPPPPAPSPLSPPRHTPPPPSQERRGGGGEKTGEGGGGHGGRSGSFRKYSEEAFPAHHEGVRGDRSPVAGYYDVKCVLLL